MRKHLTGGRCLAAFNLAWVIVDVLALPDEQLTDGMRRFQRRHPVLAPLMLTATYLHLLNAYTRLRLGWVDPYCWPARMVRWMVT